MPAKCYVALGSNLGDRVGHLAAARKAFEDSRHSRITAAGGLYETSPVGGPADQGLYLNTALGLRTCLTPHEFLRFCLSTEERLGRERAEPNGPRVIDIDVLLYDECVVETAELILPHPRMHLRRFVLAPLADIAPAVFHPVCRRTVSQLLNELPPADATGQRCVRIADAGNEG